MKTHIEFDALVATNVPVSLRNSLLLHIKDHPGAKRSRGWKLPTQLSLPNQSMSYFRDLCQTTWPRVMKLTKYNATNLLARKSIHIIFHFSFAGESVREIERAYHCNSLPIISIFRYCCRYLTSLPSFSRIFLQFCLMLLLGKALVHSAFKSYRFYIHNHRYPLLLI